MKHQFQVKLVFFLSVYPMSTPLYIERIQQFFNMLKSLDLKFHFFLAMQIFSTFAGILSDNIQEEDLE
jgi:hypothetical protein